ncbi:MAG: sucrase ferredoxin, partial [Streptomycetaceae bacterium]|nr:sucrase ferredoxin [Streptomycetaceae bacterium]
RWEVTVAHVDGRHWRVVVVQGASLPPRAESCGTSVLGSPARMDVVAVRELTPPSALAS